MYCNGDTCNYMYIRHIYSPSLSRPKGPKFPVIILFLKKKNLMYPCFGVILMYSYWLYVGIVTLLQGEFFTLEKKMKAPCRMSILRKTHVILSNLEVPMSHVNLRNTHVVFSNLGVQTPNIKMSL